MIDRERFSRMLEESARLMLEEADALSEIDSKFGDGDHGITVTKIAKVIQQQVAAWDEGQPLKDFLEDLGMDVMAVRGGSAGPLYGTLVGGLGVELADDETVVTGDAARRMFAGCLSELRDITTAQGGGQDHDGRRRSPQSRRRPRHAPLTTRPTCSPLRPWTRRPRRALRPPSSSPRSSAVRSSYERADHRHARRGRRVHLALLPAASRTPHVPSLREHPAAPARQVAFRAVSASRVSAAANRPPTRGEQATMQMKKFINDPENLTAGAAGGLCGGSPGPGDAGRSAHGYQQ